MATLLTLLVGGYARVPAFRAAADALPNAWILAFHQTRFVGFYFLALYERGELPYAFAVWGGVGDILVATLALVFLAAGPAALANRSGVLQAWNAFGLLDILFVVATATRLAAADPESMAPLLRLPLGLLPTFLVPLIIASHLLVLRRGLRRDPPKPVGDAR